MDKLFTPKTLLTLIKITAILVFVMLGCVFFYSIDTTVSVVNSAYPVPTFSEIFGYIAGQIVIYTSITFFALIGLGVAHNWLKNLK